MIVVERGGPHLGLCQQYQPDVDTEEDEGGYEGGASIARVFVVSMNTPS